MEKKEAKKVGADKAVAKLDKAAMKRAKGGIVSPDRRLRLPPDWRKLS